MGDKPNFMQITLYYISIPIVWSGGTLTVIAGHDYDNQHQCL